MGKGIKEIKEATPTYKLSDTYQNKKNDIQLALQYIVESVISVSGNTCLVMTSYLMVMTASDDSQLYPTTRLLLSKLMEKYGDAPGM